MVVLNYSIAVAMVHGAPKGRELLRSVDSDSRVAGHRRLDNDGSGAELYVDRGGPAP